MIRSLGIYFLIASSAFGSTSAIAQELSDLDVYGVWRTTPTDGHVRVDDCGDGTPCGVIIRVDPDAGLGEFDSKNPKPELRDNPIVGLTMLSGFEKGADRWRSGRIYDPQSGREYRSSLKRLPDGRLQVKGCFGPFCQTQRWDFLEDQSASLVD